MARTVPIDISLYKKAGALFLTTFLVVSISIISWRVLSNSIRKERFMGDETIWITAGLYYTDLVLGGNFEHDAWDAPKLATAGSLNQPLGKYLLGAGTRLHPRVEESDLEFRGVYTYSQSVAWNLERGKVPPERLILQAREVNAVFGTLCFLAILLAVSAYTNPIAGGIAAALMLFNGWVITCFSWALTDTTYNLFLLLGLWAGWLLIRSKNRLHLILSSALCGCVAGMACSVKITGLVVLGLFFLGLIAYRFGVEKPSWKESVLSLAIFGGSAFVLIYALNPFFWPTDSWANVLELPRLYERQKEMFATLSVQERLWPADRSRFVEIHRMLFSGYSIFPLEWVLFLIGTIGCGWHIFRAQSERAVRVAAVPLFYFLANYLFLIVFMQVNWPRHYISTVFAIKALTAIGLTMCATGLFKVLLRLRAEWARDEEAEA